MAAFVLVWSSYPAYGFLLQAAFDSSPKLPWALTGTGLLAFLFSLVSKWHREKWSGLMAHLFKVLSESLIPAIEAVVVVFLIYVVIAWHQMGSLRPPELSRFLPGPDHCLENPASCKPATGPNLRSTTALPLCVEDQKRPYKCNNNTELGQWIIEESDKVSSMATGVLQIHGDNQALVEQARRWAKIRFALDMKKCCLSDMTALREEAIKRVGPRAKDPKEQSLWEIIVDDSNNPMRMGLISPLVVSEYSPFLRRLGEQLKQLKPLESQ